jgi:hypothetical protein
MVWEKEMSIDAMKQALEYLDSPSSKLWPAGTQYKIIIALRLAIEQAEKQEPVAWLYLDSWGTLKLSQIMPVLVGAFPVYTAPPQRQPLTEEELRQCFLATNTAEPLAEGWPGLERFARAIERAHGIGGGE